MIRLVKRIIFIFICFILCACSVKNENTLNISEDGKVKYNVLIAFDKSLIQTLIKMDIIKSNDNISNYVSQNIKDDYLSGFVKNEYNSDEYIGNEYVYEISNIDEVSTSNNNLVVLNDESLLNESIFTKNGKEYSANFIYDLYNKYNYKDVNFLNTFTVNLPTRAISSNADKIINNGKTLIWNISNGEKKEIKFNFRFFDPIVYVSLGLLILDILLVVSIIIVICRRRVIKFE